MGFEKHWIPSSQHIKAKGSKSIKSQAMIWGGILMEQGGNIPDKIRAFFPLVWKSQRHDEKEKNVKVALL